MLLAVSDPDGWDWQLVKLSSLSSLLSLAYTRFI